MKTIKDFINNKRKFKVIHQDDIFVIVVTIIIALFLMAVAGSIQFSYHKTLNSKEPTPQVETVGNTTYNYDIHGRIIIKSEYNPNTKITTNYYYTYENNNLTNVQIVTVNETTGEIIDSLE